MSVRQRIYIACHDSIAVFAAYNFTDIDETALTGVEQIDMPVVSAAPDITGRTGLNEKYSVGRKYFVHSRLVAECGEAIAVIAA